MICAIKLINMMLGEKFQAAMGKKMAAAG